MDNSSFPVGTVTKIVSDPPGPSGSLDRAAINFSKQFSFAVQDVYRYQSANKAAERFEFQKAMWFPKNEDPWITPDELSYRSPLADQFYQACETDSNIPWCGLVAQYEEYVVRFGAHMYPDHMTLADFERVFQAIDERMAQCLK